jgi:microcystin-dependent protein
MKTTFLSLAAIISGIFFLMTINTSFAQHPSIAEIEGRGFSFQGYALDASGNAMGNTQIKVQFSIFPMGSDVVYTEEHTTTTDAFGVFSLEIGSAKRNDFSNKLNFHKNDYGLIVEIKKNDGIANYMEISRSRLLAVPYARSAANGVPVGTVVAFAGPIDNMPKGWLLCDGNLVQRTEYPQLYAAIGNSWGGNSTHFNLPDMRGMFLRGVAGTSDEDPGKGNRTVTKTGGNSGNLVGSKQQDDFLSHKHTGTAESTGSAHKHNTGIDMGVYGGSGSFSKVRGSDTSGSAKGTDTSGAHTHPLNIANTGGSETRPRNVYVYYIIKF